MLQMKLGRYISSKKAQDRSNGSCMFRRLSQVDGHLRSSDPLVGACSTALEAVVEHINRAERWVEVQDLGPDGCIGESLQWELS